MRSASANAFAVLILATALLSLVCFFPSNDKEKGPSANDRWGEITSTGKTEKPIVIGTFHGDERMMTIQKKTVEDAFDDIERTSCGLIKLSIVWDFNPEKDLIYRVIKGENILMAIQSRDLVRFMGKEGDELLGLTRNSNSRWIFLVEDKLDYKLQWEWVAAHELTHAIGVMDHVDNGLMEERAPLHIIEKPGWLRQDIEQFCRLYDCQPEMFFDCRFR